MQHICVTAKLAYTGCSSVKHSAAVPVVERAPEEPPPFVVLVQGPPQVSQFLGSFSTALLFLRYSKDSETPELLFHPQQCAQL